LYKDAGSSLKGVEGKEADSLERQHQNCRKR
jgi:hypothetical protein